MVCTMQEDEERERFWWDNSGWEMTFVENMRMLRERRGMSQTEFAKRANEHGLAFHQPTVQRIENGQRPLKLTESLVIAGLLGSTLEQMMNDTSLPFAYSMLTEHSSWKELEGSIERLRSERGVRHKMEVIQEDLDDYRAAAERFKEPTDPAVIERAEFVLERLGWIQEALDRAMTSVEDIAAELAELPPLPASAHGGTPWDDDRG
jgi:transcriptional regulator with XRE-family HTH domain